MEKFNSFFSRYPKSDLILFFLSLFFIYVLYEYPQTMNLSPESIHNWRQADGASIARIYYENGMNFFEPKVFNVLGGEGKGAGEFPLLYYLVACLYRIFGAHNYIFRGFNLILFFCGIFSLRGITKRIVKDKFCSFIIPLFIFSSPVLMLYANGFLSDTTSLSMAFIAWNYFLRYRENKVQKYFWFSMLFFTISGLLKLNAAISLVSLGAVLLIELIEGTKNKEEKLFLRKWNSLIGFALSVGLIASWYLWAIRYNELNNATYFTTKTWQGCSIWEATAESFKSTIAAYFEDAQYIFFLPTYILLFILLISIIIYHKAIERFYYYLFLLLISGVLLFTFVFFEGIKDNIYYCVNLFILPAFIFILACLIVKNKFAATFKSLVFRITIVLFLIVNITYAKSTLSDFYHYGKLHFRINDNLTKESFRNFIDSIGIKKTDKVISFPDVTPNVTLYSIGRQGWTEFNFRRTDTLSFNKAIANGAEYLIINTPVLLTEPCIENYTGNYFANFDNVYIYKLNPYCPNKNNKFIKIKTATNRFISLNNSGKKNDLIISDSLSSSSFYLLSFGNGTVALKTKSNKFISCDTPNDGILFESTDWVGAAETFQLIKIKEGTFVLKAANGKYVSFKSNQENKINADADMVEENEMFSFVE